LPKPWDTQTMLEKVAEIVAKGAGVKPNAAGAAPAAAAPKPPVVQTPPVAAKPAADQRSATIMGMPTIKVPGSPGVPMGNAPAAAGAVNKTMIMQAAMVAPASTGELRKPATPATPATPTAAVATAPTMGVSMNRAPMVSGTPTKRSQLMERTLAKMAARLAEATGLEAGSPELLALLKLSTEVVERIVWEVVPELAEAIIRENLAELTAKR
ncbi:MAG: hypothetical protein NT062_29675, partial [Proteobacteria bacterium]|nr:hypothetical protein [Pseudomonadota bacterium]